ncbi:unnamed protein product, partial [Prorocentrum cordatum]
MRYRAPLPFGNNYRGRLGHGEGPACRVPRRVEALAGEFVTQLGRGAAPGGGAAENLLPRAVALPGSAAQIDCEHQVSAALLADGRLLAWGCNEHGQLGIGCKSSDRHAPEEVKLEVPVASFSLGSMYAGAVGEAGELFMWGYGGHGNLGLGSRASVASPALVTGMPEPAAQVACTRGQDGCKGGLNPKEGGQEGPHTIVVAASGAMYTMGTCHKGLLCNLGSKDGAFGKPWDELLPYRVGGKLRNDCDCPPMSPLAVWPPPYDSICPVTAAVSAHIHAACVDMRGEGKPPEVDTMKCYMMGPHPVGVARPLYWKHRSLQGFRVLALATGGGVVLTGRRTRLAPTPSTAALGAS